MKLLLTTAALALSTAPLLHAQAGETGVSHPDPTPITVDSDSPRQPKATPAPKPSSYVPYTAPAQPAAAIATPAATPRPSAAFNPDAEIVTTNASPAERDDSTYRPYRPSTTGGTALTPRPAEHDVDADIVTDVPLRAGEMPEGTIVKARINDSLSTKTTPQGSAFSATVTEDVLREGRVVVPAGSILDGSVTEVRGGRRIAGRAAIHLEPRRILLPDGTYYVLHAQVIEAGEEHNVRVDGEGTIVRRDHAKEMLAIVSLTTGSAAVAGAMIGGGVGAVVGAGLGAGASTVIWLKQDRQAALPRNTALVFSLTTPMLMRPLQDGAQLRP